LAQQLWAEVLLVVAVKDLVLRVALTVAGGPLIDVV
jgi:hypothetical protein